MARAIEAENYPIIDYLIKNGVNEDILLEAIADNPVENVVNYFYDQMILPVPLIKKAFDKRRNYEASLKLYERTNRDFELYNDLLKELATL